MSNGKVGWLAVSFGGGAVALVLAACSSSGSAPTPSGSDASALTYYRDVKPIVDAKCTACHYAGGIAPFALTSPEDVVAHKDAIAAATASRTMPPWPPGAGCAEYRGDRSLSDAQIAALGDWAHAGGAVGDPATFAPLDAPSTALSRVDLSLKMAVAYTPQKRPDDYRCFLIDWPKTGTSFVTGFGATPGVASIVHHALVYAAAPAQVAAYQALDDADPGPGYTCFGGPGGSDVPSQIGAWVPGVTGVDYPAGTGIRVEGGSKIILQVHYNTLDAPPEADTTTLNFKVDASVDKEAFVMPWADPQWIRQKTMTIPAGAPDTMHEFTYDALTAIAFRSQNQFSTDAPLSVWSAALHMHLHGTSGLLEIEHASGQNECLLTIPKWNFHWQGSYGFAQPKTLAPGDKLHLACHWDNSTANQPADANGQAQTPVDLNWGEGTGDEMCLGFVYLTR